MTTTIIAVITVARVTARVYRGWRIGVKMTTAVIAAAEAAMIAATEAAVTAGRLQVVNQCAQVAALIVKRNYLGCNETRVRHKRHHCDESAFTELFHVYPP
jgi:hypothetical protein